MIYKHPLADIQSNKIGEDTRIWQFVVILKGAEIGKNCNICAHTFIENDVCIGDNVTVKCGVYIWDGITIKNGAFLGPNVTFTNDKYPRAQQSFELKRTIINENASIGAGAVIICGNEIGAFSMIGAGAVVTKNIPSFTLWVGNPAKHFGYITKIGEVISLDLKDKNGLQYKLINGEPIL